MAGAFINTAATPTLITGFVAPTFTPVSTDMYPSLNYAVFFKFKYTSAYALADLTGSTFRGRGGWGASKN